MFNIFKNLTSKEQYSRRKREKTSEKKTRWQGLEKGEHGFSRDPLNKFHEEGQQESLDLELTEDDFLALGIDPDFDENDIPEGQGFESMITRDPDPEFIKELIEEYNISMRDDVKRGFERDLADAQEGTEIPFEEQDLSLQWTKKKPENISNSPETLDDHRFEYSEEEFDLMKQCATFVKEFLHKGNKKISRPVFANGKELSTAQIKEVAGEYFQVRRETPELFAKMNTKYGDWKGQVFIWKEKNHQGRPQWVSYHNNKMFVSTNNPNKYFHNGNTYYFTTGKEIVLENSKNTLQIINLQLPQEKKAD